MFHGGEDFGIIAEPYFDVDFDEVFYLTDTGRSWNNSKASVRDKVEGTDVRGRKTDDRRRTTDDRGHPGEILPAAGILPGSFHGVKMPGDKTKGMNRMAGWKKTGFKDLRFRSTFDIIEAADRGLLPDKIMINVHPQRWFDYGYNWYKELLMQNVKNVVKRAMLAYWHKR